MLDLETIKQCKDKCPNCDSILLSYQNRDIIDQGIVQLAECIDCGAQLRVLSVIVYQCTQVVGYDTE